MKKVIIFPWIHITHLPKGEAEEWVRKCWIGSVLPLVPFNPIDSCPIVRGTISDQPIANGGGYIVPNKRALEILSLEHPEATQWWHDNCTGFLARSERFIFDAECGEPIATPFCGAWGLREGAPTFDTVVDQLATDENAAGFLLEVILSAGEWWPYGHSTQISRDLVIRLAEAIARNAQMHLDYIVNEDMRCGLNFADALLNDHGGDKLFSSISSNGRTALRSLYQIATRLGVNVGRREIDLPLSLADKMEQDGLITIENGVIRLAPEW